ncbi:MAG TPA: sugar phosphate isomerase/epimerase family protein [Candidatus Limnocylindrales bacterium]|nr:sugar phosphate isomerase/epimerase family protein [Candidatus Limnocylindrales bacterium]
MNRRYFLKSASVFAAAAASGWASGDTLKPGLNAYSFNKLLNDAIRKRGPGITLDGVLDFAAKCKFDAFDPTGYFFPGYPAVPPDSYVDGLKKHAADLGIALSGTGVRNNFTTADKAVRAQGVTHIKEWVEVAARLGVPVIRVFADTQMRAQNWQSVSNNASRSDVQAWIAEALHECAEQGKKFKVKIGVQNHGDFLATGEQQLALIQAVGSEWCGPIVDTGYYKTPDPYVDIALVAPHAVNWQVKQSVFGEDSEVPTDLIRLLKIVRQSGYKGYLPIETLSPQGKPYDPFTVVPAFLAQLREAIAKTA